MDTNKNLFPWLEWIDSPVFCVKDGVIIAANYPAEQRNLSVGMDIRQIVTDQREAYDTFQNGSLYLTIQVCGLPCPASVTRTQDCDIFHLQRDGEDGTLQALALAASELRIPLANVLTVADRLLAKLEENDEETRKQAGQMNQNLYRLLRIISNMSDAGNLVHTGMETADLTALIDEIMDKAQAFFADAQVSLAYTGLDNSVFTLVNQEKLERAIYNLLSNAAKFASPGSTITASLTKSDSQIQFTVCNTTEDTLCQGNMWHRYRREPAIEDPRHGLGLGMTLISNAATIHGGTVLVDHPKAGITRVTMTLPIKKENTGNLRSPVLRIGDYAGGRDKGLLELAELLSSDAYNHIN